NAGEERTARFVSVSETRPHFTLTPPPQTDPCLTYGPPQLLNGAELKVLGDKIGRPLLSGYRVTVAVRESARDARLALGPLHRQVVWNLDVAKGHQVIGIINGSVQGEVRLAEADGKSFVDMGKISASDPAPVTFTLESDDPRLEVTVDEKSTLDFLSV